MQIVAGLSLNNFKPRVYDPTSPYYLPDLQAVMVSYAEFDKSLRRRQSAMAQGLHAYLNVPPSTEVYLDNGAFSFIKQNREVPRQAYEDFVAQAKPSWYAIPQDYIPTPLMSDADQIDCLQRTMAVNVSYRHDGYVPVIHISRQLNRYLQELQADEQLLQNKPRVALGGIVPNLLKMSKAMKPERVLQSVKQVRAALSDKQLHVFGVGGIATLHLAALLGIDSVDSAGWRNRAARGIIQLPGRGERIAANLGSWRGREPTKEEWTILEGCPCPACQQFGLEGLKLSKIEGFCNRATHNLWTLLDEARQINDHLTAGTYTEWYKDHVQNSSYLPLIQQVVTWLDEE